MKKILLSFIILVLSIFSFAENTFSSNTTGTYCDPKDSFCLEKKTKSDLKVEQSLDKLIENSVVYLIGFIYFVAIVYGMYGAYNILTAASDDEKVEKGKKIILRAVLGIIVIFSASIIAQFLLGNGTSNSLVEQTK